MKNKTKIALTLLILFSLISLNAFTQDEPYMKIVDMDSHKDFVSSSIAFHRDGNTIVSGGTHGIRLWDANTGKVLKTLTGDTWGASNVAFSPDGNTIVSVHGIVIRLWDTNTGELLKTLSAGLIGFITCIAFHPDDPIIVSSHGAILTYNDDGTVDVEKNDFSIRLWDTNTGELLKTLRGHRGLVSSVAFHPDGNTIVSSGSHVSIWYDDDNFDLKDNDFSIRLWDLNTGENLKTLKTSSAYSVAFWPDGNTIVSSHVDRIRLWDLNTGENLKTHIGPWGSVNTVAFSPDGKTIANGSSDNTIILWDANTGERLKTLTGHTGQVSSVAFHPKKNIIASGGWDNTIRFWHVPTIEPAPDDHSDTRAEATLPTVSLSESSDHVASGETFTLDATLENIDGISAATTLQFYGPVKVVLTTQQKTSGTLPGIDFTDKALDEAIPITIAEMGADSTRKETITVTAPETDGIYAYKVCIEQIDGAGETLKACSEIITVTVAALDLEVEVRAEHETVVPGKEFKLYATVRNPGNKSDKTALWFYLQNEDTKSAKGLGGFQIDPLPMSDGTTAITKHITVTAPETPGRYTYSVSVDSVEGEKNTDNNSDEFTITVEVPDLVTVESDFAGSVCTNFFLKIPDDDPDEKFNCVAYSPDGSILAGGSDNNAIYLWDSRTGELLHTFFDEQPEHGNVHSIAFSQRGNWFAIGGQGGRIRVWKKRTDNTWAEAARNQNIMLHQVIHVGRQVWSVAFSHDGTKLACGKNSTTFNASDTIDVWTLDRNSDWSHKVTLDGHSSKVNSVAFHPTQHYILASASADETAAMWDIRTQKRFHTYKFEHNNQGVNSVVFSPSGKYLASGSNDNNVIVWNVDRRYVVEKFDDLKSDHDVLSVVFMSDTVLLSVGKGPNIHKWEIGQQDPTIIESEKPSNSIAFNPTFNSIAIGIGEEHRYAGEVRQFKCTEEGNFRANDVTRETKLIDLLISPDLISDVAYTKNYTYFILRPHFALVRGVENIKHGKCTITLDTADSDYWMFLLEPEQDERGQIADLAIFATLSIIAYIPKKAFEIYSTVKSILTDAVSIFKQVTNTFQESDAGLKVTIEPAESINILNVAVVVGKVLGNAFLGSEFKPITYPYFCIIPGRLSSIDIRIEQNYDFPSSPSSTHTHTVTYEGTWDLENSAATAPRASVMSLADYPPFQQLPPEVQAYILQYFGEITNPNTLNLEAWQIPEQTSLLANYPNPFNPETWIPYQLSEPADVTLTIYDIHGRVVRGLNLGHQRAGMYHGRSRAAYWDGRNAVGEPVASGVYFYTLTAGEFTATRKMLIRK